MQNYLLENTAKEVEKALEQLRERTTDINRQRKVDRKREGEGDREWKSTVTISTGKSTKKPANELENNSDDIETRERGEDLLQLVGDLDDLRGNRDVGREDRFATDGDFDFNDSRSVGGDFGDGGRRVNRLLHLATEVDAAEDVSGGQREGDHHSRQVKADGDTSGDARKLGRSREGDAVER